MRKRTAWSALLLLLMFLLYGCGAGGGNAKTAEMEMGRGQTAGGAPQAAPSARPQEVAVADATGQPVGSTNGGAPVTDRKIIQNAEIEVRIKEADETVTTIGQAVRAAGGYVQENRVEGTRQNGRRVRLTVRVPAGAYGSLLDQVAGLGEVVNRREWINDVTEEYLDLDARIKTKEIHLAQLQKLYEKGGSIKELMELEQEIARVTAELESIKGRFNFLSNQVAYSTIAVSLFEPGVPTPTKDPQTLWERMRNSFIFSWKAMVEFSTGLLIFFVALIPSLLFLAVVGAIVWTVVWLVRRRRRRGGNGKPEA